MSVLDDIKEQYPTLAFLINDPEVGSLLRDAVDPNKGFSPTTFQAKFYQTNWYKSRSTAQREIEILRNTDPGEYTRRRIAYQSQMQVLNKSMGLNLSDDEIQYMATNFMSKGIDVNSPELTASLRGFMQNRYARIGSGTVTGAELKVRDLAKSQYYLPMSTNEVRQWSLDLAFGTKDETALRAELAKKSASLYPHLKELLGNGASMEDIFSGHRAVIAQELELSPEQIDFTKDWTKVIHQIDPATTKPRPMTLHETQTLARQDNRWWSTAKGKQADAGMANTMLKVFGKRA